MRRLIRNATPAILALAALAATAHGLTAQARQPVGPARNWGSLFIVAYPGVGRFNSPVGPDNSTATQSWNFGSGFGLGLSAAHVVGQAAQIGIEAAFAPSVGVEITDSTLAGGAAGPTTSGNAKLGDVFATGRIMTGGGGGLGLFLSGGLGFMFFGMPDPATSATDFAFRYGGGLEYQWTPRRAAFLEWGQIGAFHKHHGVSSNRVNFSQLRGGIRIGW